ncbi:MAG TPA: hypothetical protein DEB09_00510 [Candidatus Magasanikbacteria bacterium]|nr:hypothetical protein [Candidatus Magasanikbacteria bacterium]
MGALDAGLPRVDLHVRKSLGLGRRVGLLGRGRQRLAVGAQPVVLGRETVALRATLHLPILGADGVAPLAPVLIAMVRVRHHVVGLGPFTPFPETLLHRNTTWLNSPIEI